LTFGRYTVSMVEQQRTRRHAMKHESGEPTDEIIEIGLKFGSAGAWFVFLAPMGILLAVIIVEIIT
ncbi:MAG: hypothetical protein K5880_13760, partial [Hydrogenophaga sp.]|uniref:hypothetical protein n=1 Tax=Hydrogenophaga sp. TaxID=1904254 RepID=UPI0026062866